MENYFKLFDFIDSIIIVSSKKERKIVFMNQLAVETFGDKIGEECYSVIGISDNLLYEKLQNTSSDISNEKIFFYNNSLGRWYELIIKPLNMTNNADLLLAIFNDVTDRKNIENSILESEKKFRSIFESFIDIYLQANPNGDIELISPSCFQITGFSAEELIGKPVLSALFGNNTDFDFLERIKNQKKLCDFRAVLIQKNGHKLNVSINANVMDDKSIQATIRDITTIVQTEEELKLALKKSESADKIKSEFVANMSHELRTPLNGIIGYTQILKNDSSLTDKQREGLNVIDRSANHLLGLINDILDLSKIEAEKIEIEVGTFVFSDFLSGINEMINIRAQAKNIKVIYNKKTQLPKFVLGDKKRLGQILLNLLNNAIKFTDFGTVTFNVSHKNDIARFEIIDTGFGIPEDKIDDIFKPFKQLGSSVQKSEGTGLGLTISRKLVQKMGGELFVESELGSGSKFWFEIELKKVDINEDENKISYQDIVGYEGNRKTILIVDDEKDSRILLKEILHPLGFRLLEASDGIDVLKILEVEKPDLILMDIIMPMLDGVETAKEIRLNTLTKYLPIIFITAANPKDYEYVKSLNINHILLKPVDNSILLEAIKDEIGIVWSLKDKSKKEMEKTNQISIPPIEEIEVLNEILSFRNFSKLHEQLNRIESMSEDYKDFTGRIRKLAFSFNTNKIKDELKKILDGHYEIQK